MHDTGQRFITSDIVSLFGPATINFVSGSLLVGFGSGPTDSLRVAGQLGSRSQTQLG